MSEQYIQCIDKMLFKSILTFKASIVQNIGFKSTKNFI